MIWQVTSLSWVEENGFSKNPFLPIQMILENGAFFTPGLCGRGGQRRTVVPTPITVTSPPSRMVRQSQFQAFCFSGPDLYSGSREFEEQLSFAENLWSCELMARAHTLCCASISLPLS